jgi:hypothetical protein
MDEDRSAREGPRWPFYPSAEAGTGVAEHLALTRERAELRRERDRLLLRLAAELGAGGMARALGMEERRAGGLLRSAHERLEDGGAEVAAHPAAEIRLRRLRSAETARLPAGGPNGSPAPQARRPVEASPDRWEYGSPASRAHRASGVRADLAGHRFALADAHYEALGLLSSGDGLEQS